MQHQIRKDKWIQNCHKSLRKETTRENLEETEDNIEIDLRYVDCDHTEWIQTVLDKIQYREIFLNFPTCIQEVAGSNIGWDIDCTNR